MKLLYFKDDKHKNFGDELNPLLFFKLIPKLFLNPEEKYFYAIGTLLHILNPRPHVIFGSGAGYYQAIPNLKDIDVRFVRGPLTAQYLNLPPEKAITDPAILVANLGLKVGGDDVSFMPRWTTIINQPSMKDDIPSLGIKLIDPRDEPEKILQEMATSRLVLTEALHGAVVADSLRIPWIPLIAESGHHFKWFDWTASMNLRWLPADVRVQSIEWVAQNVTPSLSDNMTFYSRVHQVDREVEKLKEDYGC